jgi:hypothetical protein
VLALERCQALDRLRRREPHALDQQLPVRGGDGQLPARELAHG